MTGQQFPKLIVRDGTSQSGRVQPALQPDYALVDERSLEDLLVFAQAYAKELRYFNENNEADGDWSGFLDGKADEMAAYLENPGQFGDVDKRAWYSRPHFVLFLTFLKLLQHARTRLNGLTRRHLEFYFREALQLTSKQATPDRVHVLVELADGQDQFLLPMGSLLSAGKDSQGLDLFYRTEQDIVANRAKVDSLKSLFVKKKVIGIRDVREKPDLLKDLPVYQSLSQLSESDKAFMSMLVMALGDPNPCDQLASYPGKSAPQSQGMDISILGSLDTLLGFIRNDLYLPLPAFRTLMQLKQKLDRGQDARWVKVNAILQATGVRHSSGFKWDFAEPDNFDNNLRAALGLASWGTFFDTLPEVDDVYDLYRLRERTDVKRFIDNPNNLNIPFEDFVDMMGFVDDIHKDWRRIYDILRAAGKKKNPGRTIQPPLLRDYDPNKFDTLAQKTLGQPTFPKVDNLKLQSFDDCYREIQNLESYFHMSVENFGLIRQVNAKPNAALWEWEQVYAILEKVHIDKALKDRHASRDAQGFEAMIRFALGDPEPGDELPEAKKFMELNLDKDGQYIREKLFLEPANFKYIQDTENKQQSTGPKPTEDDWAKIYQMLELAQFRKRGEPRAQIEIWENCYAAADATKLQAQFGLKEEVATPRWKTFGGDLATPTATGFAIASPLLALAEGTRIITLRLHFNEDFFNRDAINATLQELFPFRFWLSTEEKLVEVASEKLAGEKTGTRARTLVVESGQGDQAAPIDVLEIILILDPQFPPVAPCTVEPNIQTPWPLLQIRLADIAEKNDSIHRAFASLVLKKVQLDVYVEGITQLTLQNDDGVLNAKKPFEPFGFEPVIGSSFYIAHPELCSKKLDSLNLIIDWLGAPDNFNTYYLGYSDLENPKKPPTSPIADNTRFKAKLRLFDNRAFFGVNDSGIQLFNTAKASETHQFSIAQNEIESACPNYRQDLRPVLAEEVLDWNRYWQIELLGTDFQHAIYPRAATAYANRKDAAGNPDPYVVNPPYTPKIKRLTMGYSASVEIDPADDNPATVDKLYHIEPFGYRELAVDDQKHWLPQYTNEGELFIGIKDLAPPQNLSLLFQIAEGSADPDVAREPVRWWYLSGDRWESLEQGRLLADTTNGVLNSGIITFDLPCVEPSTLLPPDLFWIQASIARNSRSVGDMVAICAQAVSAVFIDQGNAPDHLDQPLRTESITGLAEPLPEVKAIHQPYSSTGGQGPEQASRFYTRVSERLRHKNRALTPWDYERLVLEAFPGVYKVKCLPVGTSADPRQAGGIKIIVIPNIRGKLPFDPFEPKVPVDKLVEIERYLNRQGSPLARITVDNPTYVRLKVRLGVRLTETGNLGYYQQALELALQHYLAPWAYDDSAEIVFGGKINANLIVNFVERLDYVDYVAGIKLFTSLKADDEPKQADTQFVVAPEAILVSDREHQIDLITEEVYEEKFFTGINYMKVELDFVIA